MKILSFALPDIHAFPERDNNLNEAENILIKTIAECKEEQLLDDSKFFHCYIVTDFAILYIGHEVNRDMAVLVGLWKILSFALPDSSL
jgi:hypothetical protein